MTDHDRPPAAAVPTADPCIADPNSPNSRGVHARFHTRIRTGEGVRR